MDIYSLLAEMGKRKASDLHIIAGSPILFRIDGRLASAKEKKVTAEESKLLVHSLMNKEQQKRFEQIHELDFSLSVPEIGRFRINVHLQRGSVATGHLVLATLHTRDAAQAIDRIVDVFPPLQQSQIRLQLSLSLEAVVAQNLLPRKYGEGRIPAVEILVATPAVRNLIRNAEIHQLYLVMETGARFGMQTMGQALKNLVRGGHIDASLASRLARQAKDFRGFLKSGL